MILSILICSIRSRLETFLPKLLDSLARQCKEFPDQVEVITMIDLEGMTVGDKRNRLVSCARGTYVAFVDDDDEISDHYVRRLLEAANSQADVLVFTADVTLDDGPTKPCFYSIDYPQDRNLPDRYERLPNHLCAIRRKIVLRHPFNSINFGEDSLFAKSILEELDSQFVIPEHLYHYRYRSDVSATRWKRTRD